MPCTFSFAVANSKQNNEVKINKTSFYLLLLSTVLLSCKEDAVRSSISTGDATFVCVEEERTLEYTRDDDPGEAYVPVEKSLSYGTCEEYRNQDKNTFDAFRSGLCSAGVAYSDTNCETEFQKTTLDYAFDCELKNSTRMYGVAAGTSNTKRNVLVLWGESYCFSINVFADPDNAVQFD